MELMKLFGTEKIGKILLRLAPPVMLAQLIQALYNIVDSLFVGKYADSGLTALSIVYPLQLLMIALAVGTGVGVNTVMAARLGIGRKKQAEEMRSSLQKGDWLTTIGGVYGRVVAITDRTVVIETSEDRVRIEFLKSAIGSVGTLDEQAAAAQRGSRKAKKGAEAEKPVEAPVEAPAEETPAPPMT